MHFHGLNLNADVGGVELRGDALSLSEHELPRSCGVV
jgi:hypothetical protein